MMIRRAHVLMAVLAAIVATYAVVEDPTGLATRHIARNEASFLVCVGEVQQDSTDECLALFRQVYSAGLTPEQSRRVARHVYEIEFEYDWEPYDPEEQAARDAEPYDGPFDGRFPYPSYNCGENCERCC